MALRDELAQFVYELKFEDLSADLVRFTKLCILDQIGVTIAGPPILTESFGKIDILANEWGGREESTVVGTSIKMPCPNAVWLNTAYSTATSLDAIHKSTMIHLSAGLIPALIAVAEKQKVGGKELITAFIAGAEVGIRVGLALGSDSVFELGFHPTCCAIPFACAAGSGKLLGLDVKGIQQAISIAAIQAGGLYLTGGAKAHAANYNLAIAMSAEHGVRSALYAGMGVTGFAHIFENERGFIASHTRRANPDKLLYNLGSDYLVTELCIKKHSIGIYEYTSVEALSRIMASYDISVDEIEEIHLKLPTKVMRTAGAPEYPANRQRAYTNPRFILSLVAHYGESIACNIPLFGAAGLHDPMIEEFYQHTIVEPEPLLDRFYPDKKPCIIAVKLKNGAIYTESNDGPFKGDPSNPLSESELIEKFNKITADALSPDNQTFLVNSISDLEQLTDISKLVENF